MRDNPARTSDLQGGVGDAELPLPDPNELQRGGRPHALTSISVGPVAEYDLNGNMTRRWNSVWYRHDWNADNKIATIDEVQPGNGAQSLYPIEPSPLLACVR